MKIVTITEAKEQLDRLIALVEAGEEVTITKDDRPVARMVAPYPVFQQLPSLADLRATMPMQTESAGDFMRRVRDSERY